jgi:hypothetical protein
VREAQHRLLVQLPLQPVHGALRLQQGPLRPLQEPQRPQRVDEALVAAVARAEGHR